MAGLGKRMRPHTLTTPKPLIKIAGKSIVQRIVEEVNKAVKEKITDIAFVVGHFGMDVENELRETAKSVGAKAKIYYQDQALGTAHAVYCAAPMLTGKVVIAFADTLFNSDIVIDARAESIIWVKKVQSPEHFGVVVTGKNDLITDFIEKPTKPVSDMAIIGIYYFKEAQKLRKMIKYLLDNKIKGNNEYQLTDALEMLKNEGMKIKTAMVNEWLDCGNVKATLAAHARVLELVGKKEKMIGKNLKLINSVIVEPCYIGNNVKLQHTVVGPYVSLEDNVTINHSVIKHAIVRQNSIITNATLHECFVGSNAEITGGGNSIDISDYSKISL